MSMTMADIIAKVGKGEKASKDLTYQEATTAMRASWVATKRHVVWAATPDLRSRRQEPYRVFGRVAWSSRPGG